MYHKFMLRKRYLIWVRISDLPRDIITHPVFSSFTTVQVTSLQAQSKSFYDIIFRAPFQC